MQCLDVKDSDINKKNDEKNNNKSESKEKSDKKIKPFDQLKAKVLKIEKLYEIMKAEVANNTGNINKISNKLGDLMEEEGGEKEEEKKEGENQNQHIASESSKNSIKNQISDMNKKIKFLLGDISLEEIEDRKNSHKLLNLEEMNRRITKIQYTKVDNVELDSKHEKMSNRVDEIEHRMNELIYGLYGEPGYNDPKQRAAFVKQEDFDEYKKNNEDEIKKIWEEIHELKRTTEILLSHLKEKTSLKELDDMKNYLLQKVDEIILGLNKKFVGKNENTYALKNLEEQFKKIIVILAAKAEHENDNWLIAKKPIIGLSCASCESYIGEIKEEPNNKYIPWNKMPLREREKEQEKEKDKDKDKIYRLGNGYSKVLKMVGVDNNGNVTINPASSMDNNLLFGSNNENNKSKEGLDLQINKTIYNERVKSAHSKNSKEKTKTIDAMKNKKINKKLPRIRNMSVDNIDRVIENPNPNLLLTVKASANGNTTNPKITKILKKTQGKFDI